MFVKSLSLARWRMGGSQVAQWVLLGMLCLTFVVAQAAPRKGAAAGGKAAAVAKPQVQFKTNMGEFTVELYPAAAPKTVENFLQYVNSGHYNGTVFHRVIDNFMVQGGGYDANLEQKPTRDPVVHEGRQALKAGLRNTVGTLAMARTSAPNSATAQFFINVADNAMLNAPNPDGHGYAVFGRVVEGKDVVDKIRAVATGNRGMHQNVPTTPVVIESAKVVDAK